jgi:hypothetical protein
MSKSMRARTNYPRIAAGAAVFVLTCGFAHPVSPPGGAPPIAVKTCEITQNLTNQRPFRPWYGWRYPDSGPAPTTSGLRIVFANQTNTPATQVGFRVSYRGDHEFVHDVGTFSPGVAIDHSYSVFVDYAYLGSRPNACVPVFAQFSDGSTWRAAPATRPQAH